MAHYIDERGMRRLRRERLIKDQERQRRLDEEIRLLQRQRDQYIVEQRDRRAMYPYGPEMEYEDQLADEGSQITIDRWTGSDTSVFDNAFTDRKTPLVENSKGISKAQNTDNEKTLRTDEREEQWSGYQRFEDRGNTRIPELGTQLRLGADIEKDRRDVRISYGNRHGDEENIANTQPGSETRLTLTRADQSKGYGNEPLPHDTDERRCFGNRMRNSDTETESSERKGGYFNMLRINEK